MCFQNIKIQQLTLAAEVVEKQWEICIYKKQTRKDNQTLDMKQYLIMRWKGVTMYMLWVLNSQTNQPLHVSI